MTTRLYLNDTSTVSFDAIVQSCQGVNSGYEIVLDRTYFYPEGGGQPNDLGFIDDVALIGVDNRAGDVIHKTDAPLPVGKVVHCHIDSARRLDLSQQHTGQHVLSAVANKLFQAATVGFHLTENNMTVDLDKRLTSQQVDALEVATNQIIRQNITIKAHYPTVDQLDQYQLRKAPPVSENIRLIALGDYDCVPCGGTHLNTTGDVGTLKILNFDKYKGGTRLYFCCGIRAINEQIRERHIFAKLTKQLAVPKGELDTALTKLHHKVNTLQTRINQHEQIHVLHLADTAKSTQKKYDQVNYIALNCKDLSPTAYKQLLAELLTDFNGLALITNLTAQGGQLTLVNQSNDHTIDITKIFNDLKAQCHINGGGSAVRCQAGSKDAHAINRAYQLANQVLEQTLASRYKLSL